MLIEDPSESVAHDKPEEMEVNDESVDDHDHERSAEIVEVSPLERGVHESKSSGLLAIHVAEEIVLDDFEMSSVPDRGCSGLLGLSERECFSRQWCLERHLAHVLLMLPRLGLFVLWW